MGQQKQHLETRAAARPRNLQSQAQTCVLGVAKRLLDRLALRIQTDESIGGEMVQAGARYHQLRLAGATGIERAMDSMKSKKLAPGTGNCPVYLEPVEGPVRQF